MTRKTAAFCWRRQITPFFLVNSQKTCSHASHLDPIPLTGEICPESCNLCLLPLRLKSVRLGYDLPFPYLLLLLPPSISHHFVLPHPTWPSKRAWHWRPYTAAIATGPTLPTRRSRPRGRDRRDRDRGDVAAARGLDARDLWPH